MEPGHVGRRRPGRLATNLTEYIAGFSGNVDVFERFTFDNEIAAMAEKNRLLLVVSKSAGEHFAVTAGQNRGRRATG